MRARYVAICFIAAGCVSFPKSSAVTQFAQATTTATTLLQNAAKLDLLLAQKNGYEQGVTEYIIGENDFDFPPRDFPLLDKQRIAARVQILEAISAYAQALAALNDPQQASKVGDAITQLGSVVTTFTTSNFPGVNSAEIGPVSALIGTTTAFLVSQRSAIAIHDATNAADPWIKKAVELLSNDFVILNRRFGRRLHELVAAQKQKIRYIRDDHTVNRIELEQRYSDLYAAYLDLSTQVTALDQSTAILNALVAAHDELRSSQDTARSIVEFKKFGRRNFD